MFRLVGEESVFRGHVIDVVVGTFAGPDGREFRRDIVRHPGAVGVVPVTDGGEVLLVRQYRPALGREILEIPAGVRDVQGEDLVATVRRELVEEVGRTAAVVAPLAEFFVAPGFSDERFFLFLATGLADCPRDAQGPEEEAMTVERVALADAPALIASGAIEDSKTITGLLLARDRWPS